MKFFHLKACQQMTDFAAQLINHYLKTHIETSVVDPDPD
jgi:hypothetical protein